MLCRLSGDEVDCPLSGESPWSVAGGVRLHIEGAKLGCEVVFQSSEKIGGLHAEFYRRFDDRANGVAGITGRISVVATSPPDLQREDAHAAAVTGGLP